MSDEQDEQHGLVGWILAIAVTVAIAVSFLTGALGVFGSGSNTNGSTATATQPQVAAAGRADITSTVVVSQAARVHFASGKTDLPADAADLLKDVVSRLNSDGTAVAVLSGFHDKTGDPAVNAELAKKRAFAVRDLLVASGIDLARIELRKPQETTGGADDREARRVDVHTEKR